MEELGEPSLLDVNGASEAVAIGEQLLNVPVGSLQLRPRDKLVRLQHQFTSVVAKHIAHKWWAFFADSDDKGMRQMAVRMVEKDAPMPRRLARVWAASGSMML